MNYWQYIQQNIDKFSNHCVNEDHCIARVVLDVYFGKKWDTVINKPAVKHLTEKQNKEIINLVDFYAKLPKSFEKANKYSKRLRNEYKKSI